MFLPCLLPQKRVNDTISTESFGTEKHFGAERNVSFRRCFIDAIIRIFMRTERPLDKERLTIDQLAPGMKLAEPITNASGVTLMPAGIRLTPMFIARIRKWNIEALDVLLEKRRPDTAAKRAALASKAAENARGGTPADAPGAQLEEFARRTALEISRPFVNVKNNPLMMQLRASVIKALVLHGAKGVANVLRHSPEPEQRGSD